MPDYEKSPLLGKRRIYPIYQRWSTCGMLSSVAAGDRFGGGSKQK